ncbi:unnamed protein product [Hydatigera taeniaeformis]|uniref:Fibronectin type-III domain-containing protein n=1 Tax=Hydatigena taeniaeformis TaxID=6205 RepID=A0A0R3XCV1_HYDTA|nr:unnamed protein product [Hydatigera taeniaeformis]
MRKPTFAAKLLASASTLQIVIDDPQDVEGEFEGYEVLMRTGGVVSVHQWRSVANLSASERNYSIGGIKPLALHTVTVRGRLSSNRLSAFAKPVELMGAKRAYDVITGYDINWSVNGHLNETLHVSTEESHTFTDLQSEQNYYASVSAISRPNSSFNIQLLGAPSPTRSVVTPPARGGRSHFTVCHAFYPPTAMQQPMFVVLLKREV